MRIRLITFLSVGLLTSALRAEWTFQEVRTASNDVLVAFFTSDTLNLDEADLSDSTMWTVNGRPAKALYRYSTQANACDHHIYIETDPLVEGRDYTVSTPYGDKSIRFSSRNVFCESIKTNQAGYSALADRRYANFAIWLGSGGIRSIQGKLPEYDVFHLKNGTIVQQGVLSEWGQDPSSGDRVYRIDLSAVPEGGPYKIAVKGYGASHPFGVGGEFACRAAYITFRAQYLQRCGCPIHEPDIRKNPCHTRVYDVDGPIGEANIVVRGDEPSFTCYGGYHDAGDADRRAYHMVNPIINLMIYEAFPDYFFDGQYDVPGEFDADYHILGMANAIPDIVDEAEWGALVWEYLQNKDGSVHFGTETKGYPDPFAAPMDRDDKPYGTVRVDSRATCTSAGLFMHLARILRPFKPEKSDMLFRRAEKARAAGDTLMADAERLYYHVQRYLLTGDESDHAQIKALYSIADGMVDRLYETPGYSLNDAYFDNPAYVFGYVIEDDLPTDPDIVNHFTAAIKAAADSNIAELRRHAYPVGNDAAKGGWGHNVRQPQYACAPLLYWRLSGEQAYLDAASELMDYKLGLNPLGISYVTGLGFHRVHNPHDRESAYTKSLGWGPKPGITVFGPGVMPRWMRRNMNAIPNVAEIAKERQFVDDLRVISFTEFTIFETLTHDAFYTVLAGGKKWDQADPFELE